MPKKKNHNQEARDMMEDLSRKISIKHDFDCQKLLAELHILMHAEGLALALSGFDSPESDYGTVILVAKCKKDDTLLVASKIANVTREIMKEHYGDEYGTNFGGDKLRPC